MPNWQPHLFGRGRRLRSCSLLKVLALSALVALAGSSGVARSASTYQVPAAIAGDCSVDVTQPILTWIASVPDNSTLSFTPSACYRIEGTLEIRGRTGLDFEGNGAAFRSFNAPEDQRALWRVIGSTGFVFHNMVLTGSYAKGGTFTSSLQHAHAIDLRGSSADVGGITASSLGGDCLYFGLGYDGVTKSSGSFHDSSCSLTSRNGVAVSAGQNITVKIPSKPQNRSQ